MSKIKISNIEQIAPLQVKVYLDQNVLTNYDYYDLFNYSIEPTIQFNSIEAYPTTLTNYIIINLEYPLLNNTFYKITLDKDGITNVLGESLDINNNSYRFLSSTQKPYIVSVVSIDEATIRVTYDRPMATNVLDVNNYDIYSDFNGHQIFLDSVSIVNPTTYDLNINLNKSHMTDNFYHSLIIKNITDIAGNIIDSSITYSFLGICTTFTRLIDLVFDTTIIPNKLTLTFDREIDEVSSENVSSFLITSATGFIPFISSINITGENKVIVLEISETTGSQTYTITCTDYLNDIYANKIDPSYKSLNFTGSGHKPSLRYMSYVSDNVLEVYFDESIRDNQYTRDVLNYVFDNGLVVNKVIDITESKVTLGISNFYKGIKYTLTISNPGFTDSAGNVLNFPATTFLEVPIDEEYVNNGIVLYNFLTAGLRNLDENQQLKRYVDIFQKTFDDNNKRIKSLYNLISLSDIEDKYLKYKYLEYGWYGYEDILDTFSYDKIRYILKISPSLFKRRGAAGSYVEALNTLFNYDSYEVDFFESRSILEESTYLSNKGLGTDFVLVDYQSFYNTYLNIVDPNNTVNKKLIERIVELFKPSIENVTLCYYKLYEPFDAKFESIKYNITEDNVTHTTNSSYTVEDNVLKFDQAAKYETIYSASTVSKKWTQRFYVQAHFTPKTFSTATDAFYIVIKHNNGSDNHYYISCNFNNELKITRTNTAVNVTVNLLDFDLNILNDKTYGLKVEFEESGSLDYIKVFLEGNLVYSGSHTKVTSLGNIGVGKNSKECWISKFRIFDLNTSSKVI